jgi:ADP-heptose:LPS heptosyltransferase
MPFVLRQLSVLGRKVRSSQEGRRLLTQFTEWRELQKRLPAAAPAENQLLVIRLDDIGDYLLFRNQLGMYKKSPRWRHHTVTLLGNASWRDIFSTFDSQSVDDALWVNKGQYLTDAAYRGQIWHALRARGVETVIAPSRTRPLQLDDLCMLAAAPRHSLGSVNTYVHDSWNQISDALYGKLFKPADARIHEFDFNGQFATWSCGIRYEGDRPTLERRLYSPVAGHYIVCFVGANTRSKRWPAKRWIEFIDRYRRHHSGRVILAGAGTTEVAAAQAIQAHTGAENIAGKVSLVELLNWVGGAAAVITNDTMAAHMSVSCGRPTVIIANGVNHTRFTEYESAGIAHIKTVYPEVFMRKRRKLGYFQYNYADAVTRDIASISASEVLAQLDLLPQDAS